MITTYINISTTQVKEETENFEEIQDGLTIFLDQAQIGIDVCTFVSEENLHQVDIYTNKEESDYFNISNEAPKFEDFELIQTFYIKESKSVILQDLLSELLKRSHLISDECDLLKYDMSSFQVES